MPGILQGWAPKVGALSPNGEVEGKSFRSRSKLEGFDTWVFPKIGFFSPKNHPILIGFSRINHPFWGTPSFGNARILLQKQVWEFFFWRWTFFKKKNTPKIIKKSTHTHRERNELKKLDFCWSQGWHPTKTDICPVKLEGNRFQAASNADWFDGDAFGRPVTCRIFGIFGKPWKKKRVIYFWITRKQM